MSPCWRRTRRSTQGVTIACTLGPFAVEGVPEGEYVGTCFELGLHGSKEIPGVFIGAVLRILVYPQHLSVDVENDVLVVLILVAGGIARAAALRMSFHHPSQQLDLSTHKELEWV